MDKNLKHKELTGKIIGAAMKVHNYFRNGFREKVYHKALSIELNKRHIDHSIEVEMPIYYHDIKIGLRRVDILVEDVIWLELKAVSQLDNTHLAQAVNYLEAFNLEVGLLINFGAKSLEFKRLYNKKKTGINGD